ncbi:MAG TPA: VWA domain-containing protein [Anaerolineales bacterium]|nr:VWA domain-containing protein [Anaerolineales bacterium]
MNLTNRSQKLNRFRNCHVFGALLLVYLPFIGSLSLAGYSQSVPAPSSRPAPPAIAVKAELVVLPVRVIDGDGDFVSGLSVGNFRVYENGRLQRIGLFQREDTPVTVGLVVDRSRSMGPKLAEVATAIIAFAQSSNPQDEMFVAYFNEGVSIDMPSGNPFTHDPAELASAVSAVSAGGGTALYDAVIEGLNHLQLAHGDKKALIIVSDGGDNASRHKYADVFALARRSQTVIYSIGLVDDPNQEVDRKVLQRLSNDTGGMAFFPEARQSVVSISARIARALRAQYTLGFTPDKTDGDHSFRKIEVKVTAPGRGKIRIQTRPGYSNTEPLATAGKRGS